jgi:hypothetical protein
MEVFSFQYLDFPPAGLPSGSSIKKSSCQAVSNRYVHNFMSEEVGSLVYYVSCYLNSSTAQQLYHVNSLNANKLCI